MRHNHINNLSGKSGDLHWTLIEQTPNLDWLLLTKRPNKVNQLAPWGDAWPGNVWVGTTVENQEWADKRIPHLLAVPSVVRFLSAEPLLGPVDLSRYLTGSPRVDWVIAGGESGAKARPMDPDWVLAVRDQCAAAGVPFHFKQWGEYGPVLGDPHELIKIGKKKAGRVLEGQHWDGFPEVQL